MASVFNGAALLVFPELTVSGTQGVLDLGDNDVLIDYTGASPINDIQNAVKLARSGGTWFGKGITSGRAANNPAHNTTLCVIEGADYLRMHGAGTQFHGASVDSTSVLIKYTYYGDANFSGTVNFDDYVATDIGFNTSLSGWCNGDYNYSGAVDFDDYVLIDTAFNTQSGTLGGHRANGSRVDLVAHPSVREPARHVGGEEIQWET